MAQVQWEWNTAGGSHRSTAGCWESYHPNLFVSHSATLISGGSASGISVMLPGMWWLFDFGEGDTVRSTAVEGVCAFLVGDSIRKRFRPSFWCGGSGLFSSGGWRFPGRSCAPLHSLAGLFCVPHAGDAVFAPSPETFAGWSFEKKREMPVCFIPPTYIAIK